MCSIRTVTCQETTYAIQLNNLVWVTSLDDYSIPSNLIRESCNPSHSPIPIIPNNRYDRLGCQTRPLSPAISVLVPIGV